MRPHPSHLLPGACLLTTIPGYAPPLVHLLKTDGEQIRLPTFTYDGDTFHFPNREDESPETLAANQVKEITFPGPSETEKPLHAETLPWLKDIDSDPLILQNGDRLPLQLQGITEHHLEGTLSSGQELRIDRDRVLRLRLQPRKP